MIAHGKYCVTDKEASVGGECPKRDSDHGANRKEYRSVQYSCFMLCKLTEMLLRLCEMLSINSGYQLAKNK
jgi:hypothetical protein